MVFSEMAALCAANVPERSVAAWIRGFDFAKYHPAAAIRQAAAIAAVIAIFLTVRVALVVCVRVSGRDNCNRSATSAVERGRFAGSFARQAATVSSQTGGTSAGSTLNSLRLSVSEGAVRS